MAGSLYIGNQKVCPAITLGGVNNTNLTVTPSTSAQSFSPSSPYTGYGTVDVEAVTSGIDANITAGNIKDGVSILGVTGTYTGGESSKYGCTVDNFLGNVDANGVLQKPADTTGNIVFAGVQDVAKSALRYKFMANENLTHSVSFPNLTAITGDYSCEYMFWACYGLVSALFPELVTISGQSACNYMFRVCSGLTSVSLPKLKTISGQNSCSYMFNGCESLTTVSLTALDTITGTSCCSYMFQSCTGLTDVYFPAVKTTSFGNKTNQFSNLLNGTGSGVTHTLHFPSNLSTKVSGLSGYPNFGGTSGSVSVLFDLTATS